VPRRLYDDLPEVRLNTAWTLSGGIMSAIQPVSRIAAPFDTQLYHIPNHLGDIISVSKVHEATALWISLS
jgi:hypothetical protein